MWMQSPISTSAPFIAAASGTQTWNADNYATHGRFNWDVAGPALEMLNPQPGRPSAAARACRCHLGLYMRRTAWPWAATFGVVSELACWFALLVVRIVIKPPLQKLNLSGLEMNTQDALMSHWRIPRGPQYMSDSIQLRRRASFGLGLWRWRRHSAACRRRMPRHGRRLQPAAAGSGAGPRVTMPKFHEH